MIHLGTGYSRKQLYRSCRQRIFSATLFGILLFAGLIPLAPLPMAAMAQAQIPNIPPPTFSSPRGYYTAPIQVALSSTPGTTIRYTVNGDAPSYEIGTIYTTPIAITTTTVLRAIAYTNISNRSTVATHTYLYVNAVRNQPNIAPPGWPAIFAANYDGLAVDRWNNPFNPNGYPADYEMDPEIVNHPNYTDRVEEALLAIPTISLATNLPYLWEPTSGIFYNPNDKANDPGSDPDPLYPTSGFDPWERPVSIEWFAPPQWFSDTLSSPASVGEAAGIEVHGETSRRPKNTPKHSFRLSFKSQYGSGKLDFALFDFGNPAAKFDQLVLLNGGNRIWSYHDRDQRGEADYVNDEWSRRTWIQMGQLGPRGTYAHLYINGLYWGLYNVAERPGDKFLQSYLGGAESDYDYITAQEESGDIPVAGSGTLDAYSEIIALLGDTLPAAPPIGGVEMVPSTPITTQNSLAPIDNVTYAALAALMDMENFADYMLHTHFIGKTDWPNHNWNAYRKRIGPDTRLKWLTWDDDSGLNNEERQWDLPNHLLDYRASPSWIFLRLLTNAEFRQLYRDRIYRHLQLPYDPVAQTGALTPANCAAVYTDLIDLIDPAIIGESARWGDYVRDVYARPDASPNKTFPAYLHSYDLAANDPVNITVTWPITHPAYASSLQTDQKSWQTVTGEKLSVYCPERTGELLSQYERNTIRLRGSASAPTQTLPIQIWPADSLLAPDYGQDGGAVSSSYGLRISNLNASNAGEIYYTVDGSDPRQVGGAPSPSAITGGDSITITINQVTRVLARIRVDDGKWSPLTDYTFYPPQPFHKLVINEIHYNPLADSRDGEAYEFIELYNKGNIALRLDNIQFTRGISYKFPPNSTLGAGEYLVLAADPAAFSIRYPGVPVFDNLAGDFRGNLSNDGETIELRDALVDFNGLGGTVIDIVKFDDELPWPLPADGVGPSLELNAPDLDNAQASNWHASAPQHGTPGAANSLPPLVELTSPIGGKTLLVGQAITLTATASDPNGSISKVEFLANGVAIAGCTDTSAPYQCVWAPTAANLYQITARATDNDLGTATTDPVAVTVNEPPNQPPIVAISSPTHGATSIVGNVVPLQAVASDADGTVSSVSFAINGIPLAECTDTAAPFICSWTPTLSGLYLVTATATDNKGAATISEAVSVTSNEPDNQPPAITIINPSDGTNFSLGNPITINAVTGDPDGSVAQVVFFANGSQIPDCVDTTSPYACTWTPITTGIHSLTAQAFDNRDASTISAVVAVTVNTLGNQLPTASINTPGPGATVQVGQTVLVAASAADSDGEVAEVVFFANGGIIAGCVDTASPYTCNWQPTTATVYNLSVLVTDNDGGTALSVPIAVTAAAIEPENAPPTVSLISPTEDTNFLVGEPILLQANASDVDGNVTRVTFLVNGVALPSCSDSVAPYECAWSAETAGVYTLIAQATDEEGASADSLPILVTANTVDNPPPVLAISSPANGATVQVGQPTLITVQTEALASQQASESAAIVQVIFFANGSQIAGCIDQAAPFQCSWTPTAAGTYALTALATDEAGNGGTALAITVTAIASPVDAQQTLFLPLISR